MMDAHRKVDVFYVSIWFDYSVVQMALAALFPPQTCMLPHRPPVWRQIRENDKNCSVNVNVFREKINRFTFTLELLL